jgi:hypothetical protein
VELFNRRTGPSTLQLNRSNQGDKDSRGNGHLGAG